MARENMFSKCNLQIRKLFNAKLKCGINSNRTDVELVHFMNMS